MTSLQERDLNPTRKDNFHWFLLIKSTDDGLLIKAETSNMANWCMHCVRLCFNKHFFLRRLI
jgi:hypothetical protein